MIHLLHIGRATNRYFSAFYLVICNLSGLYVVERAAGRDAEHYLWLAYQNRAKLGWAASNKNRNEQY